MTAPRQTRIRVGTRVLAFALLGAALGVVVAFLTPARLEIAGSGARVWLRAGQHYDQLGVAGVLTGRLATSRTVLGESFGVRADLDIDAGQLTDSTGAFDVDVLPAYIQAYSDPDQIVFDVRHALVLHFAVDALVGAGLLLTVYGARAGHRLWRLRYDRRHALDLAPRVRAYRAPERAFARRAAIFALAALVIDLVPASAYHQRPQEVVVGDPALAGTPFAGVQVEGLLRPALVAVQNYIETYFAQTNSYYDALRSALQDKLAAEPVALPTGGDVVNLGFVTDRHCNIGMDRVVIALLDHFEVRTLVSAGDDAFSGSFGFESACTRNLADKSAAKDIADVFVGGNHDSPTTLAAEADQGIKTLTGDVVEVGGLRFVGSPDPRTSRYGQGIVPADRGAQDKLLTDQGEALGRAACSSTAPVIAVAHDPLAGATALRSGCGHVTLALDGHTHAEGEPTAVATADGTTGYQFTGGSAGGAPGETAVERSFATSLTVGPLNHDAWVSIVSVDRGTGALRGVTSFHFTPARDIIVTQRLVS